MILVGTSIWIDHLQSVEPTLVARLGEDEAGSHPTVVEELALGSIKNRAKMLTLLADLWHFLPSPTTRCWAAQPVGSRSECRRYASGTTRRGKSGILTSASGRCRTHLSSIFRDGGPRLPRPDGIQDESAPLLNQYDVAQRDTHTRNDRAERPRGARGCKSPYRSEDNHCQRDQRPQDFHRDVRAAVAVPKIRLVHRGKASSVSHDQPTQAAPSSAPDGHAESRACVRLAVLSGERIWS